MRYTRIFFAALALTLVAAGVSKPAPVEHQTVPSVTEQYLNESSIWYPDGRVVRVRYPDGTEVT